MKPLWKPAGVSAALSVLFLLLYGGSNRITALRPHVGSFYFAWERHIPFVPWMILPYMSIDLFFIAAPFMARSGRELQMIAGRIAMAITIASACFLLFPLKFAFERTHVDGPLGLIFNNFRILDLPFNQFPSLHIALLFILLDINYHHAKGPLRWSLIAWFILIGLSALLTYQHHFVDILGGVALAAICFHLIRDQPLRAPFIPNRRVGMFYAAGAVLSAIAAFAWMPWTVVLFWPAFSLAFVAAGYLFIGPHVYRKENGTFCITTWLILAPVLLGQRLSLAYYIRQCRAYDRLTAHLWIGRRLSTAEARQACAAGVTAVIDLTAEFSESRPFRDAAYLSLPILDLTAPTAGQIDRAVAFIKHNADRGIVYLHCKAGYSRTAAIAGAYLLANGDAQTEEEALAVLRHCRPTLIVRPEAMAALRDFYSQKIVGLRGVPSAAPI